jgi:predicted esterase
MYQMILRTMIIALAFGIMPAFADRATDFQVYLPHGHSSEVPAGLIVYVSPVESGEIPDDWKSVLDHRNLIWIGVNKSGNTMPREQRIAEAKASLAFAADQYELNVKRIYIAGMSGGAQVAAIVSARHPELFKGGLFFCGVDPWSERDLDPWFESPPVGLEFIKQNSYVFVSGTEDFKLAAVAGVYRKYRKAGVEASRLIVVDGMGHELPDTGTFDRALEFLDHDRTIRIQGEK